MLYCSACDRTVDAFCLKCGEALGWPLDERDMETDDLDFITVARTLQCGSVVDYRKLWGCYPGEPRVLPSDLDGVVERCDNLNFRECKPPGYELNEYSGEVRMYLSLTGRKGISVCVDWLTGKWGLSKDDKARWFWTVSYHPVERQVIIAGAMGERVDMPLEKAKKCETAWWNEASLGRIISSERCKAILEGRT